MAARPTAVTWAAGFGGAFLIYAAIRNRNPLTSLNSNLSGAGGGAAPLGGPLLSGGQQSAAAGGTGSTDSGSIPTPMLVSIGGGHRLEPASAAAYAAASARYGGLIPLTDSYRTPAQQAACHQAKPDACTDPAHSYHVKGQAIDVNGSKVPGGYNNAKLTAALAATGWVRWNPSGEPWHWSHGGRG